MTKWSIGVITLIIVGIFANGIHVFAEESTIMYYGKGIVDESSPFADETIRTILNKDQVTIVHPGQSGIEIVRMDVRPSDACIQTQFTMCFVGVVTEIKNTNIHDIGDEIGITLDLQNKKQIVTVNSGAIQGTTVTINLSKTIIKSDAPFVIAITREGGFAGLPRETMTIDSSNNTVTTMLGKNTATLDLSQNEIDRVTKQLRKSNLFNIVKTDYSPHPSSADYFTYTLTINQGIFQKTVTWTDTSDDIPYSLVSLRDVISEVIETAGSY